MPDDRTVLDHLLEGREALRREVDRLTTAIAELDTVIGQIGGAGRRVGPPTGNDHSTVEPVNPPAEVEPRTVAGGTSRRSESRSTPRRAPARRSEGSESTGDHPKSIRVHVLDMLGSEERDFGLAEIIDRIHAEGIQAHDDAVRSITIKLMKDGRVERVGRGQYRLARRGQRAAAAATTSSAPEISGAPTPDAVAPEVVTSPEPDADDSYTPPLNLGQPWDSGH